MRAIIIDRWAVLREGLGPLLGRGGHEVVRAVGSAAEATALLDVRRDVDLVLLGSVDDQPAVDAAQALRGAGSGAKVVALADDPPPSTVDGLLDAGVAGIVGRLQEDVDLLGSIERIGHGERVLSTEAIDSLMGSFGAVLPELERSDDAGSVTPRQREILAWLHRGADTKEIATRLFLGQAAVERQVAALCRQLGAADRDQAVATALRLGLVEGAVHWGGGELDAEAPRRRVPTWERTAS